MIVDNMFKKIQGYVDHIHTPAGTIVVFQVGDSQTPFAVMVPGKWLVDPDLWVWKQSYDEIIEYFHGKSFPNDLSLVDSIVQRVVNKFDRETVFNTDPFDDVWENFTTAEEVDELKAGWVALNGDAIRKFGDDVIDSVVRTAVRTVANRAICSLLSKKGIVA